MIGRRHNTEEEKKKGGRYWINIEEGKCTVCKSEIVNWCVCGGFRRKYDEKVKNEEIEDLPDPSR